MKNGKIDYKITDIDYFESDAIITMNGVEFYFQFPDGKEPTIHHALAFIKKELKNAKVGHS